NRQGNDDDGRRGHASPAGPLLDPPLDTAPRLQRTPASIPSLPCESLWKSCGTHTLSSPATGGGGEAGTSFRGFACTISGVGTTELAPRTARRASRNRRGQALTERISVTWAGLVSDVWSPVLVDFL